MAENNDKYMVHWVERGENVERIFSGDKIIERINAINDLVFELYQELKLSGGLSGHKSMMKEVEYEITDMIEDIQYAQEHYLTIGYIE